MLPDATFTIDWSTGSVWRERADADPMLIYMSFKQSSSGSFRDGVWLALGIEQKDFEASLEAKLS
jgi:hypothetical protein